jgi:hypothetical protein
VWKTDVVKGATFSPGSLLHLLYASFYSACLFLGNGGLSLYAQGLSCRQLHWTSCDFLESLSLRLSMEDNKMMVSPKQEDALETLCKL